MATDAQPTAREQTAPRAAMARGVRTAAGIAAWLPALCLWAGVCALYWATRTRYNTFDAVSYANQIAHLYPRTGDRHWLFHPHHLLFNATGYGLWRLARALGYGGGPLVVLQSANAVLGATGVLLFYLTLRNLMQRSRWLPLLVALGLAVSFGYWICATDGRVNMPSTTLLLAAFALLCRLLGNGRIGLAALAGGVSGLAVLYHQSAILFLPVGLAGALLAEDGAFKLPGAVRRGRLLRTLAFAGSWAAMVVLPYGLIAWFGLGLHSPGAFRHWTTTYSELGWWWDLHLGHDLRMDAYALRRAAFAEPPGKQGTFHVNPRVPAEVLLLYFATLTGWFAAVYAFCVVLPLLWRSPGRRVLLLSTLWIATYAAFFTIWSPGYFVFWVVTLIPISLLLTLGMAHWRARRGGILVNWLVGLWIALYGTVNVFASILPHLAPDASPFQRMAASVHRNTQRGDLIVLAGMGDGEQCEVDIPYFADRDVTSLHTTWTRARNDKARALASVQSQIGAVLASGHAVYALDEIWHNTHTADALQARHAISRADLKTLFAPYRRTPAWTGPRGPVWRLAAVGPARS